MTTILSITIVIALALASVFVQQPSPEVIGSGGSRWGTR